MPTCNLYRIKFPVGALLWTNLGIFPGINVEFDDWSLGLCAERTALISALSHGAQTFYGIFVHAIHGDLSTPCGACRQMLSEHMLFSKLYSLHKDYTCNPIIIQILYEFIKICVYYAQIPLFIKKVYFLY